MSLYESGCSIIVRPNSSSRAEVVGVVERVVAVGVDHERQVGEALAHRAHVVDVLAAS